MEQIEIQRFITSVLVQEREAQKLTQAQLAVLTGLSQDKISKCENGSREVSAIELFILAKALNKHISYFYPAF